MPRSLAPIPAQAQIVATNGTILDFFRLRWQQLVDGFSQAPTLASLSKLAQAAALVTTTLWTTRSKGTYRITIYVHITQAATTSSSVQVTIGWIENGSAVTKTFAAVTGNTTQTTDGQSYEVPADNASGLTVSTTYASVGATPMQYRLEASVEQCV